MNETQKEEEWMDEEIMEEALRQYWEEGGDNAMIPSESCCYVSHGRAYICNNGGILSVYNVKTLIETT